LRLQDLTEILIHRNQRGAVEACWAHNPEDLPEIFKHCKQRGAVEACWAHNPEVAEIINHCQQRGAVEAFWAHNAEVGGSKPLAAALLYRRITTDTNFIFTRWAVLINYLNSGFTRNIKKTASSVAQWKRAGPITQRSVDRNRSLLPTIAAE
uniref:ANK_REP_REGION domain-containing protein n=1 Tax=Toxocara canis TaxID=6265 RepID=A0A183U7K2_TOXCA